jgi:hypothetical protein
LRHQELLGVVQVIDAASLSQHVQRYRAFARIASARCRAQRLLGGLILAAQKDVDDRPYRPRFRRGVQELRDRGTF